MNFSQKYIFETLIALLLLACPCMAQETPESSPDDQVVAELADGELSPVHPMPPPPPRHGGSRGEPRPDTPARQPGGDRLPPPVRHYFTQLKQENPAEYERLLKLRVENREAFMREMAERLPRRRNESEEKFRKLDRQCWELAEKLRSEPAPENAEELQKQLAALVAESIDSMIDETKQRLAEVQARLNQMERLRDRIVQQRLDFYLKAPKENSPSSPAAKN